MKKIMINRKVWHSLGNSYDTCNNITYDKNEMKSGLLNRVSPLIGDNTG